ncbi:ATP dependent peptidase CodWX, CodW component. Threonine peptidase. MEROPS family T01B [Desulfonatronum thiosulfatophilum]|uniref:ATP-dependent protease subunit HslV n=1 Tax=Desulfonatronum thiosulfatophilum TaxID=617002 RepID=A0A1G6DR62_9BACT|nr:ATP-dependent protease subunit HslV [Desulfonatronum thiosulfatophilum]SDB47611.1 ATP dependent peptidase CodWX, CodW component. Threonine peptidase. MEROPS family T01B [Desulfonatronum thiosulfatophilum]
MHLHGTTILAVRDAHGVAMAGDGQVTMGQSVALKHKARKVRKIYKDRVIVGFAGATADAMTLFERFEAKLEQFNGNLVRASVEMAKEWRLDKYLRRLEAMLLVADDTSILLLSGTGDVIEPDDGVAAIGSGGSFALAAARALVRNSSLEGEEIVRKAMAITAEICVFTNDQLTLETLRKDASNKEITTS